MRGRERPPLTYLDGVGSGVAAMAIAVATYLAYYSIRFAEMYAAFGGPLPPITRLVLHPGWYVGMPLLVAGGVGLAHVRRRRFALITLGAIAVAADVFWYFAAWAPVRQLSGNISAE